MPELPSSGCWSWEMRSFCVASSWYSVLWQPAQNRALTQLSFPEETIWTPSQHKCVPALPWNESNLGCRCSYALAELARKGSQEDPASACESGESKSQGFYIVMGHPRIVCGCRKLSKSQLSIHDKNFWKKDSCWEFSLIVRHSLPSGCFTTVEHFRHSKRLPILLRNSAVDLAVPGSTPAAMRASGTNETDSLITWLANFSFMFAKGFG